MKGLHQNTDLSRGGGVSKDVGLTIAPTSFLIDINYLTYSFLESASNDTQPIAL